MAGDAVLDAERLYPLEGLAVNVAGIDWRCRSRVHVTLNKPANYEPENRS